MKHLFAKWLSALLIAALLLTPVAMMEEADTEAPVVVEAGNDDENPANPGVGESADVNPEESDEVVNAEDEPIIVEAFEAALSEAEDVDLDGTDADVQEVEFELGEVEATEGADALYGAGTSGSNGYVIDENTFPDAYFRAYVAEKFDNNPKDGILSEGELASVRNINLSTWPDKANIASVDGYDVFSNLTTLNVSNCTCLEHLDVFSNLTTLNVSNCTCLEHLSCNKTFNLSELDISGCSNLTTLFCWRTSLSELDLRSNQNLEHLYCYENGLTKLDISGCTKLTELECWTNDLTQLDISRCTNLTRLDCGNNDLTRLDVSCCTKLELLSCYLNPKLKTLDISNCDVLDSAVNLNAPERIDWDADGQIEYVGYGHYIEKDEEGSWDSWRLKCDEGVTIITTKNKAPAAAPAPAPAPAPAAPTVPVINATAKNTKTGITAAPGTTAQLDLGGAAGKSFKSSNKKVATVDQNGNITFRKAGKVKITFKVGKKKRTVTIKVTDPTIPTSVTVTPATTDVKKGDQVTLTPVIPEGTNTTFKWKTSNKKVATVKNGVVTFKKKGKVTITCTAKRGKKKARVRFTVSK